jgi:hypothetical protein
MFLCIYKLVAVLTEVLKDVVVVVVVVVVAAVAMVVMIMMATESFK